MKSYKFEHELDMGSVLNLEVVSLKPTMRTFRGFSSVQ